MSTKRQIEPSRHDACNRRTTRGKPHTKNELESVFSMVKSKIKKKVKGEYVRPQRKPQGNIRSVAPAKVLAYEAVIESRGITPEAMVEEEDFFDVPVGSSCYCDMRPYMEKAQLSNGHRPSERRDKTPQKKKNKNIGFNLGSGHKVKRSQQPMQHARHDPEQGGGQKGRGRPEVDDDDDDGAIGKVIGFFDNADRQQSGLSLLGKVFGASNTKLQLEFDPRRPYFTYWVTLIQVIVYIIILCVYGFAPVGIGTKTYQEEVLMTSLAIEQVEHQEVENLWIGPREYDLIHLGAKFSPCMRKDDNMEAALEYDRDKERETACCVRNDGSGCVQVAGDECSDTLATWMKWDVDNLGYQDRTSGAVCGQDPKYCLTPASADAHIWEDDITEWPLCTETSNITGATDDYHMSCEVVGRPCCIGIQGECIIATREYCDFVKGYFHDDKFLCSQVYCLEEVCGMTSFLDPSRPDQFYRLFFSQFLHAGLFVLGITVIFQLLIQRDIEKIVGWWRMAIIYLGGGVVGSLASAIFLPYHVEAGPSGSQFAVLACLSVEVFRWNKDNSPGKTIARLFVLMLILFLFGLLPMVDNYAHLFGYLFGLMLSIGFRPYKKLAGHNFRKPTQYACMAMFILVAAVIFGILVAIFYAATINECEYCSYFNCIPFTDTFCDGMHIKIERDGIDVATYKSNFTA